MTMRVLHIDAFTERPFAGNPAAVCLLDLERDAEWMQAVAREMNLSETAFVGPGREDGGAFPLRWFTPAIEVDLCGHATLASAFALWHEGLCSPEEAVRFSTRSGELAAARRGELIELDFPRQTVKTVEPPAGLVEALGVDAESVGSDGVDYLVAVGDEEAVRRLEPDFRALREVGARGTMVTARSRADGIDFVSRFFAPASGVDEDPVTGSAHCTLGPYWAERLSKNELVAQQVSARGGVIRVRVEGERVRLAGGAVLVAVGELLV